MPGSKRPQIPLPKSWKSHVRSAMLNVVSLSQYAAMYTRSEAADSTNGRVRLKVEKDRLLEELALKNEELRIKDARMARSSCHRRQMSFPAYLFRCHRRSRSAQAASFRQSTPRHLRPVSSGNLVADRRQRTTEFVSVKECPQPASFAGQRPSHLPSPGHRRMLK